MYPTLRAGRMQMRLCPAVVGEREAHLGARQRDTAESFLAVGKLGRGTSEELASGRRVEVKVAHFDRSPGGRGGRLRCGQSTAARSKFPRVRALLGPAQHAEMGNSRNTGQRFTAESQAGDALQVFERSDLAGGVAGERKRQLLPCDACAVVCDPDLPDAAVGKVHG